MDLNALHILGFGLIAIFLYLQLKKL